MRLHGSQADGARTPPIPSATRGERAASHAGRARSSDGGGRMDHACAGATGSSLTERSKHFPPNRTFSWSLLFEENCFSFWKDATTAARNPCS